MLINKNFFGGSLLSLILIACGSGNLQKSNNSNSDLQILLDNAISSDEAKSGHVTGIPLTFQCDGLYGNQPLSIATGKINNQPNAANLPVDAIFEIASLSKSFLAVVALQLSDEINPKTSQKYFGENGLDTTVGEILRDDFYSKWKNVKLRQLLNMTSPIIERNDTEINQTWSDDPYHYFLTSEILKIIHDKYDLKTGKDWYYSNTNYILMSEIITKVTGVSAKDQVINRIIKPLHLSHTYYIANLPRKEISEQQESLFMSGYFYSDFSPQSEKAYFGVDTTQFSLSFANGSGSMLSSTADINNYIRELFTPNSRLLTSSQFKQLTTFVAIQDEDKYKSGDVLNDGINQNSPYGFGLGIYAQYASINGKNAIIYTYTGELQGFKAQWGYVKDNHASFVVAINSTESNASHLFTKLVNKSVEKIFTDCN
jgi:D-alanyl-D-alanine carboxypeptidase